MRDISRNGELIRFLLRLKRNKLVEESNLMSLESWVKMRAEVFASISANTGMNKNRSREE